jgi:hypothetical protein
VLGVGLAGSVQSSAQNSNARKSAEKIFVGYISDDQCGLKHMAGMGDDKSCTLMCVKNGKFVLADTQFKECKDDIDRMKGSANAPVAEIKST